MIPQEAKWFQHQLRGFSPSELSPMLNVGSGDREYNSKLQPWIDKYCFGPLIAKGTKIEMLDKKEAPEINWVGDISDPTFIRSFKQNSFTSVWCTNVLEHVPNPKITAQMLLRILKPAGLLIVSAPFQFPYHEDPIDNEFRPQIEELAQLFPGTKICASATVSGGFYGGLLCYQLLYGSRTAILRKVFSRQTGRRRILNGHLNHFFNRISANCVILRKYTV